MAIELNPLSRKNRNITDLSFRGLLKLRSVWKELGWEWVEKVGNRGSRTSAFRKWIGAIHCKNEREKRIAAKLIEIKSTRLLVLFRERCFHLTYVYVDGPRINYHSLEEKKRGLLVGLFALGVSVKSLRKEEVTWVRNLGRMLLVARTARALVQELVSTPCKTSEAELFYRKGLYQLRVQLNSLLRQLTTCSTAKSRPKKLRC